MYIVTTRPTVLGDLTRSASKEDGKAALDLRQSDLTEMDLPLADGRAWLCRDQLKLADTGGLGR